MAAGGDRVGFAALDLSTGEFRATEFHGGCGRPANSGRIAATAAKGSVVPLAAPLFERDSCIPAGAAATVPSTLASGHGRKLRSTTGFSLPTTPFLCWKIILGCCRWKASASQASRPRPRLPGRFCYYVRSTQRGTLDHVDRIGFYERQHCLVLDAVTVRNLELIEPLFAGTDAGVTLFRAMDATVTPMGKRLLRSWMLRPSIETGRDRCPAGCSEAAASRRPSLERNCGRALDGIFDLERLLSRVTLETANPRDVLALAASLEQNSGGAHCPGAFRGGASASSARLVDELGDLRERIDKPSSPNRQSRSVTAG